MMSKEQDNVSVSTVTKSSSEQTQTRQTFADSKRKLIRCAGGRPDYHCISPEEHNVDSAPVAVIPSTTAAPTVLSTAEAATAPPTTTSPTGTDFAPTAAPSLSPTQAPTTYNFNEEFTLFPTSILTPFPTSTADTIAPTFEPTKQPAQSSTPPSSNGSYEFEIVTRSPDATWSPTWPTPLASRTPAPTPIQTSNANNSPSTQQPPLFPPTSTSQQETNLPTTYSGTGDNSGGTGGDNDLLTCKADDKGHFGSTNGDQSTKKIVQYQYQVDTKPKFQMTASHLNSRVLASIEKAISDVIVATFFSPDDGYVCVDAKTMTRRKLSMLHSPQHPNKEKRTLQQSIATAFDNDSNTGSSTLVGLSALPADQIMEDAGVTCPFPVQGSNGSSDVPSCFVVQGGLSFFGSDQDTDDLGWAEAVALAELEQAMNAGSLDNVDPAVSAIRFIPPNTPLYNTADNNGPAQLEGGAGTANNNVVSSPPTWSWVIGAVGFFGLIAACFLVLIYRRRRQVVNDDTNTDFDSAAPRKTRGSFRDTVPVEIVDDNSECDQSDIYPDIEQNSTDRNFSNDGQSMDISSVNPSSPDTSWRQVRGPHEEPMDEYSRLDVNSTDPNQPVVKPILDEESDMSMDIYI